ncbi:MAG: PEGA domain-containing protein [Deltaproteobacteria bacterium]|nr:PEGA domain-containing protein [Deltaproteobacteria bacterium]
MEVNFGDLEIDSLPSRAAVYLNGMMVGTTPYELHRLEPETTFQVTLRLDGYKEWRRDIKIFGGKKELLKVSLEKIKKAK